MAKAHRICSVEGCHKPSVGRGLCDNHYKVARRAEDKANGIVRINPRKCDIKGCSKPHFAKGLCSAHYTRQLRYGDPHIRLAASKGEPLQWLLDHVEHSGDECLPWPFATARGYGVLEYDGRMEVACRVMCKIVHGEAPSPLHEVAHSCGKGQHGCINPGHLRWDTRAGNHADKKLHGTHLQGEAIGNHKLTEADVREIKRLRAEGASVSDLASRFRVSRSAISKINVGKAWAWVA